MAVNWGLQGQGFDPLEALRYAGVQAQTRAAQQKARQESEQIARDQQVRGQIAPLLQQGDFATARTTALGAGSFDLADYASKLQADQRKQLGDQAEALGGVAARLVTLPVAMRAQAFAVAKPSLLARGISEADLDGADFSDASLQGYIATATNATDALKAYAETQKPVTLAEGARLVSPTGATIAENPSAPKWQAVPAGGALYRTDGGTATAVAGGGGMSYAPPAASSSGNGGGAVPVSGRTQFGWTPRARNGGDNSDAAVDGKISGMARALGVDPDASLEGLTDRQIAEALTLSEGGAGSLADRNNNPGNLIDPKSGGYRKFPNREAGIQAAAAQVRRNRGRGQNTIRTMVEGIPVGGRREQRQTQSSGGVIYGPPKERDAPTGYQWSGDRLTPIPGGPADMDGNGSLSEEALDFAARQGLANGGKVPQGYGRNKAAQSAITNRMAQIAQIEGKTVDYYVAQEQTRKSRQVALTRFTSGKQGDTIRSLNVAVDHLQTLQAAAQALQNGNTPLFNRIRQEVAQRTGAAAPTNFAAVRQIVLNEVIKGVVGGATAQADREEALSLVNAAQSPQQLAGALHQIKELLGGQLRGLNSQYKQSTGRDDFAGFLLPNTQRALGFKRRGGGGMNVGQSSNVAGFKITRTR